MCFFNMEIHRADNCNTADIHMDNMDMESMGIDNYKDNKVGIKHFQGSYLPNLLKMAPQFQIQNQLHLCHNLCHIDRTYYQIVPSKSPFLTYPIRYGRSEEGR